MLNEKIILKFTHSEKQASEKFMNELIEFVKKKEKKYFGNLEYKEEITMMVITNAILNIIASYSPVVPDHSVLKNNINCYLSNFNAHIEMFTDRQTKI